MRSREYPAKIDGPRDSSSASTYLQESDLEIYNFLFDNHPLPAWICDADSDKFLAVNLAAVREFGFSEMEFLSLPAPHVCICKTIPPTTVDSSHRLQYRRKDGSTLEAKVQTKNLILRNRQVCVSLFEDVCNSNQVEQDLRVLASALADSSVAVMITDADWSVDGPNVVHVNSGFTAISGFTPDEVVGKPLNLLQPTNSEALSLSQIKQDLDQAGSADYQIVNFGRSGSKYSVECHVTPLRDESGIIAQYLILQRDVTERNRLQEQLRQAQKMESVGRLAGGIAHDFNNLLTIILGYSGLLSLEFSDAAADDKRIRGLREIQKAAQKAATLTSQLLAFSRKKVVRSRMIELNAVITNVEGMLCRLIGDDVDLQMTLEPNLGTVLADPGQVEQVLMNLAVNARDAMPHGGQLTIETRNVEISTQFAVAADIAPGRYVALAITDSGVGMDEETRSRVFEPFFTTKEPGRGTGLGLSMVHGFAKQVGGAVQIYSELGRGACFKIYLPRMDSRAEQESALANVEPPRGTGLILVVEDEVSIRELVREILTTAGYEVITAADAKQALDFANNHASDIDLLLTDVVLPGTSGPDLAVTLKLLQPSLRVLFASGYSDQALSRQGILAQGAAFLQKPFETGSLLSLVSELMTSKTLRVQAG